MKDYITDTTLDACSIEAIRRRWLEMSDDEYAVYTERAKAAPVVAAYRIADYRKDDPRMIEARRRWMEMDEEEHADTANTAPVAWRSDELIEPRQTAEIEPLNSR